MKIKKNSNNEKDIISLNKKSSFIKTFNNNLNSIKYNFFNKVNNRNKISIIVNFLDINEQLPLMKLNSIISKILINKYNLPFKSIAALKQIKNNKKSIESKYSKILSNFKNIIENNKIDREEYQYIISFLLKNINNNYIIFDEVNNNSDNSINDKNNKEKEINNLAPRKRILNELKILCEILSKIKYLKNITHIKFNLSNIDNIINEQNLKKCEYDKLYFVNIFQNITHIEIDKIEKSFFFINRLISFENNSIDNIGKMNLNNICIKINNETILNYDKYNSLYIPKLTKLKYLFLYKVNLSIFCLNEIINKNIKLVKLVINSCSNNNISLYDEKEYNILINKSINSCKQLKHIEFNNNNFSIFLINKILSNLFELFFHINNEINFISCGFPFNIKVNNENNEKDFSVEIPNSIKDCQNIIFSENFDKYLSIKFNPSLSYYIKKNKRIIELSNYLAKQSEYILNEIKYEKIKLNLYNSDSFSISNNIKKVMKNYYQKNITKYLQICASFKSGELTPAFDSKNKNENVTSIEKFTLFFQNEEEIISLFGHKIVLAIILCFPKIKIISFKNVNFMNDNQKFREGFDDITEFFELILFGKDKKDFEFLKNKEIVLKEIKFSNCYCCNNLIVKDILDDIENKIYSYLGKKLLKFSFMG